MGLNEDTGQFMAVKALPIGGRTGDAETLYHEIQLMRKLEHPNIVRYLGAQVRETIGIDRRGCVETVESERRGSAPVQGGRDHQKNMKYLPI